MKTTFNKLKLKQKFRFEHESPEVIRTALQIGKTEIWCPHQKSDPYNAESEVFRKNEEVVILVDENGAPLSDKLDYWMFNVIEEALKKHYDEQLQKSGTNDVLKFICDSKGFEESEKHFKEIKFNRYHSIGKIWQTMMRIETMKELISDKILEELEKQ